MNTKELKTEMINKKYYSDTFKFQFDKVFRRNKAPP